MLRFLFSFLLFIIPCQALSYEWQGNDHFIVKQVISGDGFILDNGDIVRLAQIDAPSAGPNNYFGTDAKNYLSSLVLNKNITLKYGGLKRDKYNRILAQAFVEKDGKNLWVQEEMLKAGKARIHTYYDNRSDIEEFWQAERYARHNSIGIWNYPKFQVRFATKEALLNSENSFQLVEGKILNIKQYGSLIKLSFGNDDSQDFCALIPKKAWHFWPNGSADILAMNGMNVRIRGKVSKSQIERETKSGRIFRAHGPQIWLDHPEQIEFLLVQ